MLLSDNKLRAISSGNEAYICSLSLLTICGMVEDAAVRSIDDPQEEFFEKQADLNIMAAGLAEQLLHGIKVTPEEDYAKTQYEFFDEKDSYRCVHMLLGAISPAIGRKMKKMAEHPNVPHEEVMYMFNLSKKLLTTLCQQQGIEMEQKTFWEIREDLAQLSTGSYKRALIRSGRGEEHAEEASLVMLNSYREAFGKIDEILEEKREIEHENPSPWFS